MYFYNSDHELADQEMFVQQVLESPEMEDEILESLQYKETKIGVFSKHPETQRFVSAPYSILGKFLAPNDRDVIGEGHGNIHIIFAKKLFKVFCFSNAFSSKLWS